LRALGISRPKLLDKIYLIQHLARKGPTLADVAQVIGRSERGIHDDVNRFLPAIAEAAAEVFIPSLDSQAGICAFPDFPAAIVAVDTTLLMSESSKKYAYIWKGTHSAKHKLHGWKAEAAVTPNRICVYAGEPRPGRLNDKRIFDEGELPKMLEYVSRVPGKKRKDPPRYIMRRYEALFDGGYPGIGVRGYYPEGICRLNRTAATHEIESNRQVVERFYGAVKNQYNIFKKPFRLDANLLPHFWKYACAMVNARYMLRHPEFLEPPAGFVRQVPISAVVPGGVTASPCRAPTTHPNTAWSVLTCANVMQMSKTPPPEWRADLGIHDVTPLPEEHVDDVIAADVARIIEAAERADEEPNLGP
jgi:hypothetical protein